jgi:hypothetical protein
MVLASVNAIQCKLDFTKPEQSNKQCSLPHQVGGKYPGIGMAQRNTQDCLEKESQCLLHRLKEHQLQKGFIDYTRIIPHKPPDPNLGELICKSSGWDSVAPQDESTKDRLLRESAMSAYAFQCFLQCRYDAFDVANSRIPEMSDDDGLNPKVMVLPKDLFEVKSVSSSHFDGTKYWHNKYGIPDLCSKYKEAAPTKPVHIAPKCYQLS